MSQVFRASCRALIVLLVVLAVPAVAHAQRPPHRHRVHRRAHPAALPPAARAIVWAEHRRGSAAWAWYCESFVENAFGTRGHYETAWEAALDIGLRAGSAPRGALVFFYPDVTNHEYGHVGISLGGGRMISALARVTESAIAGSSYWSALYAGWAPAPASWLVPASWSSSQRLTPSP